MNGPSQIFRERAPVISSGDHNTPLQQPIFARTDGTRYQLNMISNFTNLYDAGGSLKPSKEHLEKIIGQVKGQARFSTLVTCDG